MLSSVITKELNIEIDSKRLMEMLLIHDLGEVIIGDVSEVEVDRGVKKINENKSVKMILDNLSQENSDYYYGLWLEMESKNTEIGKFAYLLDKIDAVIKAGMYELEYNVSGLFDEFYNFQKQRCTFENSVLEDFFNYIELKYNIDNN